MWNRCGNPNGTFDISHHTQFTQMKLPLQQCFTLQYMSNILTSHFFLIWRARNFSAASETAVLTVLPSFGRGLTNESFPRMAPSITYTYHFNRMIINKCMCMSFSIPVCAPFNRSSTAVTKSCDSNRDTKKGTCCTIVRNEITESWKMSLIMKERKRGEMFWFEPYSMQ
jgi:hypothetical protein